MIAQDLPSNVKSETQERVREWQKRKSDRLAE